MRVLITGSAGMLGSAVYPEFVSAGHAVTATDLTPRTCAACQWADWTFATALQSEM